MTRGDITHLLSKFPHQASCCGKGPTQKDQHTHHLWIDQCSNSALGMRCSWQVLLGGTNFGRQFAAHRAFPAQFTHIQQPNAKGQSAASQGVAHIDTRKVFAAFGSMRFGVAVFPRG